VPRELLDGDFNEHYYATGCGRPYARDEVWTAYFARIADGIATLFPGRTLDAGCAWGLLVEALRARGIDAYGFDISSYAIGQVHASARPYCWQASATDDIDGHYDLIVCIEIFPHLTEEAGRQAVANFCRHADRVLFSSGDYPPHERHLNALGPGHWDAVFAETGFYPEARADVTFVTPWAALYSPSR
jgi:2-polyprenyl-3-methyl-5-hydroxy-6-metoxy-1,4-benzoquinol methylase